RQRVVVWFGAIALRPSHHIPHNATRRLTSKTHPPTVSESSHMQVHPSGTVRALAVAGLALAVPVLLGAQGTITGRVTASETEPLGDARVLVVNSALAATTNSDGRYTLRGVPTGRVDVRVIRVGYQESKKPVTVGNGETATLDFT